MQSTTQRVARPLPSLAGLGLAAPGEAVYLDIETTGFYARSGDLVTLVGLVYGDGPERVLEQYFATAPAAERAVLQAAARRLREFRLALTWNGDAFDLPFLSARAEAQGLAWPALASADLLPVCRRWNYQTRTLPNCRLQTVMAHFRLGRADSHGGGEMVEAYWRWVEAGDPADRDLILAHNADDLLLLPDLVPYLAPPPATDSTRAGGA